MPSRKTPKSGPTPEYFGVVLEELTKKFDTFGEGLMGVNEKLRRLENLPEEVSEIKSELSVIKAIIPRLATKEELGKLATKEELGKLATKKELGKLATKEELGKLATKEELGKLATKADLECVEKNLRQDIENLGKRLTTIEAR